MASDDNTQKTLQDLVAFKATSTPTLDRHDRAITDLTAARHTSELTVSAAVLRITALEATAAGMRKFGFWALCLILGAIGTQLVKFLLAGGIHAIPTTP